MMEKMYSTSVTSTGGRDGHVRSEDGVLDIDVRTPAELGGKGGATNPEQLFAAGYAACFNSAMNLAARMRRIRVEESTVTVTVGLNKKESGDGFVLSADIDVRIKGVTPEQGRELADAGHEICPYSNATRGNISHNLTVSVY